MTLDEAIDIIKKCGDVIIWPITNVDLSQFLYKEDDGCGCTTYYTYKDSIIALTLSDTFNAEEYWLCDNNCNSLAFLGFNKYDPNNYKKLVTLYPEI